MKIKDIKLILEQTDKSGAIEKNITTIYKLADEKPPRAHVYFYSNDNNIKGDADEFCKESPETDPSFEPKEHDDSLYSCEPSEEHKQFAYEELRKTAIASRAARKKYKKYENASDDDLPIGEIINKYGLKAEVGGKSKKQAAQSAYKELSPLLGIK